MAVLVAVLYAFSDMASSSEITALSAGGIQPQVLLRPVMIAGIFLTGFMLYFNDRVLPEANHRLSTLFSDIANTNPTLQLKPQLVNPLRTIDGSGIYYLQADEIDPLTNELTNVRVMDLSRPTTHRTTFAKRGIMAFSADRTDLFLTLYDGEIHEYSRERNREGEFQVTEFEVQISPLRDIGDVFEETTTEFRGDREMSFAMLADEAASRRERRLRLSEELERRSTYVVERALGLIPPDSVERAERGLLDDTSTDDTEGELNDNLEGPGLRSEFGGGASSDGLTDMAAITYRQYLSQIESLRLEENKFRVETHKKIAIAVACFIFVLIGGPLAVRFPRGGVGMVTGTSIGIFAIYYVGLIGGEELANRGFASPMLTMWITNIIFLCIGIVLMVRMGREAVNHRGSGWDDFVHFFATFSRPNKRAKAELQDQNQ